MLNPADMNDFEERMRILGPDGWSEEHEREFQKVLAERVSEVQEREEWYKNNVYAHKILGTPKNPHDYNPFKDYNKQQQAWLAMFETLQAYGVSMSEASMMVDKHFDDCRAHNNHRHWSYCYTNMDNGWVMVHHSEPGLCPYKSSGCNTAGFVHVHKIVKTKSKMELMAIDQYNERRKQDVGHQNIIVTPAPNKEIAAYRKIRRQSGVFVWMTALIGLALSLSGEVGPYSPAGIACLIFLCLFLLSFVVSGNAISRLKRMEEDEQDRKETQERLEKIANPPKLIRPVCFPCQMTERNIVCSPGMPKSTYDEHLNYYLRTGNLQELHRALRHIEVPTMEDWAQ